MAFVLYTLNFTHSQSRSNTGRIRYTTTRILVSCCFIFKFQVYATGTAWHWHGPAAGTGPGAAPGRHVLLFPAASGHRTMCAQHALMPCSLWLPPYPCAEHTVHLHTLHQRHKNRPLAHTGRPRKPPALGSWTVILYPGNVGVDCMSFICMFNVVW